MANVIMNGIDVSGYQVNVDYNKVKNAGYDFVIIRAGWGKESYQKDSEFERHYANASKAGMHIGAYLYSYALTDPSCTLSPREQGIAEAENFYGFIKGKKFDMPLFYDVEEQKALKHSGKDLDDLVHGFCETMEELGYFCGVYGGQDLFQNKLSADTNNRFCKWFAQYLINPWYKGSYDIWQYSIGGASGGNNPWGVPAVPGVACECDVNRCYRDFPTEIKSLGLNGYSDEPIPEPTPTPEPEKNPYKEPTELLKEGSKGEGVKWLQWKLIKDGYFNDGIDGDFGIITLGAVLACQFKNKLVTDGIVGSATRNALKK